MMEIEQGQKLEAKSQKYYFFLRRNSQSFYRTQTRGSELPSCLLQLWWRASVNGKST